jgi:ribonucleoside-diphosphate reductase alpha chain
LAEERGACPDAEEFGFAERFSNKTAIAPTASISIICGGASPGIEPIAANSYTHKTLSGSFNVKNHYLSELLEEKGQNTEAVWSSITLSEGSVQHLDFLTPDEKDLFKTAFELDQRWLIELAADRTPLVCQSQSLNLFLRADVHKRELHRLHFQAWKKGVKSLYYCRSKSVQRAESALGESVRRDAANGAVPLAGKVNGHDRPGSAATDQQSTDFEECLACQ